MRGPAALCSQCVICPPYPSILCVPQSELPRSPSPRPTRPVCVYIVQWHRVLRARLAHQPGMHGPSVPPSLPAHLWLSPGGKRHPRGVQRDKAAPVGTSGSDPQPYGWCALTDLGDQGAGVVGTSVQDGDVEQRHELKMLEGISVGRMGVPGGRAGRLQRGTRAHRRVPHRDFGWGLGWLAVTCQR